MTRLPLKLTALLACLALLLSACTAEPAQSPAESTAAPADTTTLPPETAEPVPETAAPKPLRTPSTVTVTAEDIPAFPDATAGKLYDCGDGVLMRYHAGVAQSTYTQCKLAVTAAGYTLTATDSVNRNEFDSYVRGDVALHLSFSHSEKVIRAIAEPARTPDDPAYTAVTEPLLTQVGLNFSAQVNGMSYLLRCPSGAFIIIDGGWKGEGESDKLYRLLREQQVPAGSMKMARIAAWINSHPHSDHIGVIDEFARKYGDHVILERVMYNFVSDKILAHADAKAMLEVGGSVRNLRNRLNSGCWTDTEIVKPHTGQCFSFDGAQIRIWYTHEDMYPKVDALDYMNAASLVFTVTLGDTDFLVLGDASRIVNEKIVPRFGHALACDILQPTHHGTTGGVTDLYRLADASVCLWPTSTWRMKEYAHEAYNVYLTDNVPTHYVSSDGTVTLTLPLA